MKKGLIGIIIIALIGVGYFGYTFISPSNNTASTSANNNTANNNTANNNTANNNTSNNNTANNNTSNNNTAANTSTSNNTASNTANNNTTANITKFIGTYTLNIYPCFTINHLVGAKVNLAKQLMIEKNTFKNGNYIINNPYYYIFKDPDGHYIGGYGSNDLPNPLTILLVSSKPLSQDKLQYSLNEYNSFIIQNNILLKISEKNGKAQAYAYQR
ncbi:hypothetical protein [uncultured Clostridium sp.]|jgi:hypothetical protein|uniref:hypothetical protein n=1 Tax=uncultured Clostridium sp. TaxID=59620 RepID=UPI00262B4767|nr:hypothetical protein [uncultured Clostridium sp.]